MNQKYVPFYIIQKKKKIEAIFFFKPCLEIRTDFILGLYNLIATQD